MSFAQSIADQEIDLLEGVAATLPILLALMASRPLDQDRPELRDQRLGTLGDPQPARGDHGRPERLYGPAHCVCAARHAAEDRPGHAVAGGSLMRALPHLWVIALLATPAAAATQDLVILLMANAGWSQLPQLPAAPPPPIPTAPEPAPALEPVQTEIVPIETEPVHPAPEGTDA